MAYGQYNKSHNPFILTSLDVNVFKTTILYLLLIASHVTCIILIF